MGGAAYPQAQELLITADAGGSNGYRTKLWKRELQQLADETGLGITVCHFPPGTSKWNKIEHRMFCHITENWRGRPLTSLDVIVNLISNTTTRTGLVIHADWDINAYAKGIRISKEKGKFVRFLRARQRRCLFRVLVRFLVPGDLFTVVVAPTTCFLTTCLTTCRVKGFMRG